jgi:glucokinase
VSDWVPGYIGVDIGGTNLRGAVVQSDGEVLTRFRLKSAIDDGAESFEMRLFAEIEGLIATSASKGVRVQGVGVGIPGLIGTDGSIHLSVNLRPLEGLNLSERLSSRLQLPVVSANDANLIGLGEARFGAGKGMHSLVVITIGTGLGSGLILDQKLWSGVGGFAAEFGHITVDPEGTICP